MRGREVLHHLGQLHLVCRGFVHVGHVNIEHSQLVEHAECVVIFLKFIVPLEGLFREVFNYFFANLAFSEENYAVILFGVVFDAGFMEAAQRAN